jgi:Tfp pilus assembly major pilin PilA
MENPYSHAAAAAAAPSTPEQQRQSDYEAAIGPNSGYYLKYFEQFDAGESKASWHWPAFFVTSFWFLYRKMYLPGILVLLWPWIAMFVMAMVVGVAAAASKEPPVVLIVVCLLVIAAPYFVLPVFANSMYWRHINKLISRLPNSVASVPDKRIARLERNGGTGVGPMIAVIVGGGFFFLMFVGIIAAISIPAYQDYTIRSQVTEGLNIAGMAKAEVAEYYAANGSWPGQAEIGHDFPTGKYVTEVIVDNGSVVITYGNAVNQNLMGQRLAIVPGVTSGGDIVWACGNKALPEGTQSGPGPYGSDVANKYLPAACRE